MNKLKFKYALSHQASRDRLRIRHIKTFSTADSPEQVEGLELTPDFIFHFVFHFVFVPAFAKA